MAELRVRLKFDYPPPTEPQSHQMWMLLNLEHLRTVTDLSDLIRARYFPTQRGALCLYVHDCLLPPGENARLIRDNDVIRVQWIGHDPEDDDSDKEGHLSKKRSRQQYDEAAEATPTRIPKKQKCGVQRVEKHLSRKEAEQEESSEGSRRKAKKKKISEESIQEAEAAKEILSLLQPNHEPPTKRASSGSSHQEMSPIVKKSSEISIQPITTIPLKKPSAMSLTLFAALSVKKKKSGVSVQNLGTLSVNKPSEMSLKPIIKEPSNMPLTPINKANHRRARETSSSDSEPSKRRKPPKAPNKTGTMVSMNKTKSNHEPSARTSSSDSEPSKRRKPPKAPNKTGTMVSMNKTKSNHEPSVRTSSSDSEASPAQESSSIGNKTGDMVSISKTKPDHEPPAKRTSSSIDYSASFNDPELSTSRKNPSGATSNPSNPIAGKSVFSDEMRKWKDSCGSDNGGTRPGSCGSDNGGTRPGSRASDNGGTRPGSRASDNGGTRPGSRASDNGGTRPGSRASDNGGTRPGSRASDNGGTRPGSCGSDNGGTRPGRSVDEPHREVPSPGSDWDSCIGHRPVAAQGSSRVVSPSVSNGCEAGGIHQEHVPNPGLYGRGRGVDIFPWRGRGFRGRGDQGKGRRYGSQFFHNYDLAALKKQHLEEAATNTSVIMENPPESPKKDYSALPLLAAPPQVGKVIAFKILELNENYSPELSDYKEGVVRSYDAVTQHIEVDLLSKQKMREPGKFDLVYEMEDGMEVVEYAVLPDSKITEPWSSLVTPRLVMEKGSEEGASPW